MYQMKNKVRKMKGITQRNLEKNTKENYRVLTIQICLQKKRTKAGKEEVQYKEQCQLQNLNLAFLRIRKEINMIFQIIFWFNKNNINKMFTEVELWIQKIQIFLIAVKIHSLKILSQMNLTLEIKTKRSKIRLKIQLISLIENIHPASGQRLIKMKNL